MYELLSEIYDDLFPFNEAYQVFIKPMVKLGGKACDLGCGTGRLTHLIHQLDMQVIGIDLDLMMVLKAQAKYTHLEFKKYDMTTYLNQHQGFDLLTCFGNTLVHLDQPSLKSLLENAYKALNPNGFFAVQILNYDAILKSKPPHLKDLTNQQYRLERNYFYNKNNISFQVILHKSNQSLELGIETLYPYKANELIDFAEKYGFKVTVYGDVLNQPFTPSSSYLYLVMQKI